MTTEVFANDAIGTVTSGGTSAPAAGTSESWTVNVTVAFAAASTGAGTVFRIADTATAAEPEKVLVTSCPGGTGSQAWSVTRGAEGTTPVAHTSGFTIMQVLTAASLNAMGGGSGLSVSGTQAAALVPVATSSSAVSWNGIFGTRPEWFGTISGTSGDEAAINAAISAVQSNRPGCPGPVIITQPSAISATITAANGVNIACTGQGNRQVFPSTFTGGYILPSSSFPATGAAMITIGTAGNPTTNPNGIRFDGLCMSGSLAAGTTVASITGISITDTSDVHLTGCFLAGFDRTGGTGTAVQSSAATAGNGYGLNLQNCIISGSWRGVYTTGAGCTDMRYSGNLWHSNTLALTLGGSNLGGGGAQITNDHFTYAGMPTSGYHLLLGSQAGDYAFSNNYFDQAGSAIPVQLGNSKGLFNTNHFLATATSTAATLVKLSTSGSQQLTFCNNNCNAQGSSITSLFQTTAHAGAPTGGVYAGNTVYGGAASLISVLIDSASTAIAAANTSSLYVAGNVTYT